MEQTEEKDRLGRQACDLANEVLKVVHQSGGTPGVQSTALAMALGAVCGAHAPTAPALTEVLHIMGQQIAEQATVHFNKSLREGTASLGIPGLDVAPADKGSLN